ncbi:hypothetical protein BURPS1710b_2913 [Burkholderia pseudomallei 1710b]|uniref:Uncharacterized protein n=1 Tax=Burkholderia pseudomallei (strain 1710b) TaxID=320372 RepID=Q3JQ60_BURP1|nr:hypothetical protein BURPS1710b_2913 [Burkholderia pseudomallei 1710b]
MGARRARARRARGDQGAARRAALEDLLSLRVPRRARRARVRVPQRVRRRRQARERPPHGGRDDRRRDRREHQRERRGHQHGARQRVRGFGHGRRRAEDQQPGRQPGAGGHRLRRDPAAAQEVSGEAALRRRLRHVRVGRLLHRGGGGQDLRRQGEHRRLDRRADGRVRLHRPDGQAGRRAAPAYVGREQGLLRSVLAGDAEDGCARAGNARRDPRAVHQGGEGRPRRAPARIAGHFLRAFLDGREEHRARPRRRLRDDRYCRARRAEGARPRRLHGQGKPDRSRRAPLRRGARQGRAEGGRRRRRAEAALKARAASRGSRRFASAREQQEDRGALVQIGHGRLFPLCRRAACDRLGRERQVGRDAHERRRRARRDECIEHRVIAVRRLDEDLRLIRVARLLLEFAQALRARGGVDGQVAVEREALPVQPGGHQREQDRARPDERHDLYAALVRAPHEQRAGIGDGGAAGFRHEPRVGAREHRREQPVDLARGRLHVQLANLDFLDRPFGADFLQERAGRLRVLADVIAERRGARLHGGGQHGGEHRGVAVAERVRNQIERACRHRPFTPSAAGAGAPKRG